MDIKSYINTFQDKAKARRDLALAIGCKEVTVKSWANGNRYPRREIWGAIEKATNRAVTKMDLAG